MKRSYVLLICYVRNVLINAQSVYMHEAQEDCDTLDFGTFLYSLIIIVPIAIIWYCLSAYAKDRDLRKSREVFVAQKQKEEERHKNYKEESKIFFDNLICKNIVNIDGFHAIDLGLSSGLFWGVENIGSKKITDYGNKYGWGSIKEIDSSSYYPEFGQNMLLTSIEELDIIKYDYDIALKQRGLYWKTPSSEDYVELLNKCNWEYINKYGIEGWKVIGTNGNFIFLPITYCNDTILLTLSPNENEDEIESTEVGKTKKAYFLKINRDSKQIIKANRTHCGYVRPVSYGINSIKATVDMGVCHLYGYSIDQNINTALHYLKIASDNNNPKAQRILGMLYINGDVVDKNIEAGLLLIREAAKQNDIVANRFLGNFYKQVDSSFRDITLAIKYFTKAGTFGDSKSILALVEIFMNAEYIDLFENAQYDVFAKGIQSGITEISQITEYRISRKGKTKSDNVALYNNNHMRLVMTPYDKSVDSGGEYLYFKTVEFYKIKDGTRVICDEAFTNCHNLKSIEIPSSVNFIGKNAFHKCNMIHHIELPESITYIGDGAFNFDGNIFGGNNKKELITINIPPSVKVIDGNPFCYNTLIYNKNPLFKVVDNVLYSADGTVLISYCSTKEDFIVPRGVTRIGIGAFRNTPIRTIHSPETLKIIDKHAFSGAVKLEPVVFPESLREIREEAFKWCSFKFGIVLLPWELNYVNANAFDFDWHVKIVRVPKSRIEYYKQLLSESMTEQIFDEQVVLEEGLYLNLQRDEVISTHDIEEIIVIPEGVRKIWDNAFIGVYFIESIILPKTLKEFSSAMFDDCVTIEHIYVPIGSKNFYSGILSDFTEIIEEK